MNLRLKLFAHELVLFGLTMFLGIAAAYRYMLEFPGAQIIQAPNLGLGEIVFLAVMITLFVLAIRSPRWGKYLVWTLFVIVIWSGTQVLSDIFIFSAWGLLSGFLILILFFAWRSVFSHDLAIILAIAGVGAVFGVSITPTLGIIALIALSVYDIIAVHKSKHMVRWAEGMVSIGAVSGYIIPNEIKNYFVHRAPVLANFDHERFMLLGSGDILFPLIFAASLVRQSLTEAIVVGVFSLVGLFVTHVLFVSQQKRQAMAALPPLATACLIGYLISLLLKI